MGASQQALLTASAELTYSQEVLADSPLLYLKFDEVSGTAVDSSGNGKDFTVTATQNAAGQRGVAISLNGTSNYANRTNEGAYFSLGSFAVEAFVKPSGSSGAIFSISDTTYNVAGSATPKLILVDIASSKLRIARRRTNGGGFNSISSASNISTSVMTHIVANYDDAATLAQPYINGSANGSGTSIGTAGAISFASSVPAEVGRLWGGDSTQGSAGYIIFFAGIIDELAVYAAPLSAGRVAAHYAARNR